ncbi:hypothetical protein PoB_001404200 [Plakobranchus ocellatus]|uniref:Secreted protein n=1 Tax=Plakobranchus ocellatus TaxID=259542 RepID=A0AAV3YYX8_9GAST|nr:hypothetical protein PoB_001404200 [Plakobranchus ocellatus]
MEALLKKAEILIVLWLSIRVTLRRRRCCGKPEITTHVFCRAETKENKSSFARASLFPRRLATQVAAMATVYMTWQNESPTS